MKIYVAHSSDFDYINKLYKPLHESGLNAVHDFFFPHEKERIEDTAEILKGCDLLLADVSKPSTTYLFDPKDNMSPSVTNISSMVNDCDDDEITTHINADGTEAMNNYLLDDLKKSMDFYANQKGCRYTSPFPNPVVYCEVNRNN